MRKELFITKHHIPDKLQDDVIMMLTNVVYFKDSWRVPFTIVSNKVDAVVFFTLTIILIHPMHMEYLQHSVHSDYSTHLEYIMYIYNTTCTLSA